MWEGRKKVACRNAPDLNDPVIGSRGEVLIVGAEGQPLHLIAVALKLADFFPRLHVPQSDDPVNAPGGQPLAVGADGHTPEEGRAADRRDAAEAESLQV